MVRIFNAGVLGACIRSLLLANRALSYTELSDERLKQIALDPADFDIHNSNGLLAPLLITRVPGTEGQVVAQNHFVNFFSSHLPLWQVSWQNSTGTTPATGSRELPFQNIIFKREPQWCIDRPGTCGLLTLVAHYDSKIAPEGFIGATDSAAPCAMLMYTAKTIDAQLTKLWEGMEASGERSNVGVQIVLLDGEEAFVTWTATDSLYGSRALTTEWENSPLPGVATYHDPMDQISLFVLLDLLGSAGPKVPSYFQSTHWAYRRMAQIEKRMRELGALEATPMSAFLSDHDKQPSAFTKSWVSDDHEPFMHKGVPILHIITTPFPLVWHTMDDDGDHLDMPTVHDWAKITVAFTMEWMDLMNVSSTAMT
ncbi:peptidase family M28-domain-containing protein [Microdochium trichocladiopsis]|uniref:Peptide hydrolase n=1 Tax=Microdochium trichocladiopsis TaxID=1682393 RepID=A0A9P8XUZ1_9PEZI|nr:peptidase family M28-domain-containing protein [Microdochium trichocladiopsis]KAH7020926.1 peptidase family M28-domain-containing protein [Microdochium trichocladiopsis]